MNTVVLEPLSAQAFTPYGDVIDESGEPDLIINDGLCARFHNLACINISEGRVGVSLFDSETVTLPYALEMVERHPFGSQAFLPAGDAVAIITVAEDRGGTPVHLRAFLSKRRQGFNIHKNVWHGVLAPLYEGRFFVIDRVGEGTNLETYRFETPMNVTHKDGDI